MRCLNRNKRQFWYCLYNSRGSEIVDEWGNATGEYIPSLSAPTPMVANISPASGQSGTEVFGGLENYDKVIVTDWMECPIDEYSVLYVDVTPGNNVSHDYIVRRVAKSLNSISIAISKVKVS